MNEIPNFVAFDIEIARALPDGVEDWSNHRPLGISCAATLTTGSPPVLWYGSKSSGEYGEQMNPGEAQELVKYLQDQVEQGRTILTWNGLGFDFDILAEESGMLAECSDLALNHIDMMFHVFCIKGYALGLDKAAKGMGLAGKTPGMTGDMAPRLWIDLWGAVDGQRVLRWTSNRGYPQRLPLPKGWVTVKEALKLPLPDTSWMSNPWPRSKFSGWLV